MSPRHRALFDRMLEQAIADLPEPVAALLDEVPVIAEDRPTRAMLADMDDADEILADPTSLCGLHTGPMATERGIEASGELPNQIYLFREGIVALAGGWPPDDASRAERDQALDAIYEEIVVTLLHEIGHQFGLDEDQLRDLGYD
jgi:predicted Zn-dependent protease with MMP-like domain